MVPLENSAHPASDWEQITKLAREAAELGGSPDLGR
jgi:hypothetical protein